ncbi:MAG TPA: hypothetical protein VGI35_09100 [Steroidobacteraceae bacterium]|jgi:hypothetical protein
MKPSGVQRLLPFLACLALGGCATAVVVTPQLAQTTAATCQIPARVRYDGKPDYLPTALMADSASSGEITFRYSYEAQYGLKETNFVVVMVNPLTLVGFPTGSDNLVITGRVDVVRGDKTVRTYMAAAAVKRSSTVFYEGETFTEMRRRGLLLVRDNLSGQLCHDHALLVAMLHDTAANSSKSINNP